MFILGMCMQRVNEMLEKGTNISTCVCITALRVSMCPQVCMEM